MKVRGPRLLVFVFAFGATGAKYETANFVVTASTAEAARQVALAAEEHRSQLAQDWLGRELADWATPCAIKVRVDAHSPGGFTTFVFDRGRVTDWEMIVHGPLDQVLESVLPHEISHTIFASHFRRPVPRWADEGASLLAEGESERIRQRRFAAELLRNGRCMPLRQLLTLKQYPGDQRQVLALYAQGHSVAEFLVLSAGRARYIAFLDTADRYGWDGAVQRHYGFEDVEELESRFVSWIDANRPRLEIPSGRLLVDASFEKAPTQLAVRD